MAVKIEWRPVLQPLMLKEYHPDYGNECIMVCVNPEPSFWQERQSLLAEYSRRVADVDLLQRKAQIASPENKHEAEIRAGQASTAFLEWGEREFIPGMHDWFARLWSYGDDKYTRSDVDQYQEIDPHFAAWAKARSIEMIETHASARKKV